MKLDPKGRASTLDKRTDGAIAIGQNVCSTEAGQVVIGGGNNTYRLGGVATDASRSRQEGPLQVLTPTSTATWPEMADRCSTALAMSAAMWMTTPPGSPWQRTSPTSRS